MLTDANDPDDFYHAGWWVPGSLKPGWNQTYQANFNDMFNKLRQLGLTPLVKSLPENLNLGFYFSEAEFDFLQVLTLAAAPAGSGRLPALPIVAYSIWLAAQNWGHFSPIPLLQLRGIVDELAPVQAISPSNYPCGWYLTGSFSSTWYQNLAGNYERARAQRQALGLVDLSPLYFAESTLYDGFQLLQAPASADEGAVARYSAWFATQSFGRLSYVPFLSPALIEAANLLASRNP